MVPDSFASWMRAIAYIILFVAGVLAGIALLATFPDVVTHDDQTVYIFRVD